MNIWMRLMYSAMFAAVPRCDSPIHRKDILKGSVEIVESKYLKRVRMCEIEIVGRWWVRSVEVLNIYSGKIIIKNFGKSLNSRGLDIALHGMHAKKICKDSLQHEIPTLKGKLNANFLHLWLVTLIDELYLLLWGLVKWNGEVIRPLCCLVKWSVECFMSRVLSRHSKWRAITCQFPHAFPCVSLLYLT